MASPFGFLCHSCDGASLNESEDVNFTDEDMVWVSSQASSPWMVAKPKGDILRCTEDEPMEIDLTGDDDIAERSMEQISSKPNDPITNSLLHQRPNNQKCIPSVPGPLFHSSRADNNMYYFQVSDNRGLRVNQTHERRWKILMIYCSSRFII